MRFIFAILAVLVLVAPSLQLGGTSFGEFIRGEQIQDNSIGNAKLQSNSVSTSNLQDGSVSAEKIATNSVDDTHLRAGAVTARGLSVQSVLIYIPPAQNTTTVQPINQIPAIPANNPTIPYIAAGKARGPGVILGWYPNKNGHLLRYQTDRALRQIDCTTCTNTALGTVQQPLDGTSVYSPAIESISIDSEGLVVLKYFGRGGGDAAPEIDITVVVLLQNRLGV